MRPVSGSTGLLAVLVVLTARANGVPDEDNSQFDNNKPFEDIPSIEDISPIEDINTFEDIPSIEDINPFEDINRFEEIPSIEDINPFEGTNPFDRTSPYEDSDSNEDNGPNVANDSYEDNDSNEAHDQNEDSDSIEYINPSVDKWDYREKHSNVPLLQGSKNHTLPPDRNGRVRPFYISQMQSGYGMKGRSKVLPNSPKIFEELDLEQVAEEMRQSRLSNVSCQACTAAVQAIKYFTYVGKSRDEIKELVKDFCRNMKVYTDRVCDAGSELIFDEILYVLEKTTQGPNEICAFIIGDPCGDVSDAVHEWNVKFHYPKPPVERIRIPHEPGLTIKHGSKTVQTQVLKVLHLSDTHYDPLYAEGSNANCNEPLCCREDNGPPATPEEGAGKWGDYRKCDPPRRTIETMLEHIAEVHKDIDYIILTGDLPAHDVWNQTRDGNLNTIRETLQLMFSVFPYIPIFPALGNHESAPINSFPPPRIRVPERSISWLYDELAKLWTQWIPEVSSVHIRHGGFYSINVHPGLKLISLNMNFCNNKNWWLLLNSTDPGMELQWLVTELENAERSNEKVHIIGHIPPGYPDCLKVWSRNYYSIINRYEGTVTGQFFGHTHFDEFEMFYDENDLRRPISTAYIGPSVSPYSHLNPAYRIYYVDGEYEGTTSSVIDHETWMMDLDQANRDDKPEWIKLYSARESYGMKALRPRDWNKLLKRLQTDEDLFDKFYMHYYRDSPDRPDCDEDCKKQILCDLITGKSHDRNNLCRKIYDDEVDDDYYDPDDEDMDSKDDKDVGGGDDDCLFKFRFPLLRLLLRLIAFLDSICKSINVAIMKIVIKVKVSIFKSIALVIMKIVTIFRNLIAKVAMHIMTLIKYKVGIFNSITLVIMNIVTMFKNLIAKGTIHIMTVIKCFYKMLQYAFQKLFAFFFMPCQ